MWPELIATEDCTADTVATAIFDNIVARFGLPLGISLLTDNGSAFISKLAATFCKTFNIKQFFTSPHHPQSNLRAEEFADTIHKSLRILCKDQKDWSQHLQAIAMAYRATATTNTGLSPHQVIFGQPMPVALDWGLLVEDSTTPSAEAYMADIRPKLQAFHAIAIENARDSAERHARGTNAKAVTPSFRTGDKVLLHDPSVKKGECAKLKRKYKGPYLITECRPNLNFMLKEMSSGKELKRAVHANRLRSLHELPNDYRLKGPSADVRLFATTTVHRKLKVSIRVGDIIYSQCDIIVSPANSGLHHGAGAARSIAIAASDILEYDCQAYIVAHKQLDIATPMLTASGLLGPVVKHVLHIVGPNMADEPFKSEPLLSTTAVYDCFSVCLQTADHMTDIHSIAIPAISVGNFGMDPWSVSHEAAKALVNFDAVSASSGGDLQEIEFVCLDLAIADILNVVFRQEFATPISGSTNAAEPDVNDTLTADERPTVIDTQPAPVVADALIDPAVVLPPDSNPTSVGDANEWHDIKQIVSHQRRQGRDYYLVDWVASPIKSWVQRKDLTDYALQRFYATRPPSTRGRRRRNY